LHLIFDEDRAAVLLDELGLATQQCGELSDVHVGSRTHPPHANQPHPVLTWRADALLKTTGMSSPNETVPPPLSSIFKNSRRAWWADACLSSFVNKWHLFFCSEARGAGYVKQTHGAV